MDYDKLRFAWSDLETTGTETKGGGVLEIACIVTDRHFNEFGRFETLVYPGKEAIANINDFVTKMHTDNGLLEAVKAKGVPSTQEADDKYSAFLREHNGGNKLNLILAGNSVSGVDKPFTKEFLSKSDKEMHYRVLDVTSFRIAAGLWYGDDTDFKKKKTHRAFDDIEECIAEYEHVANEVFRPRD